MDVTIYASTSDFQRTKGLCGTFNDHCEDDTSLLNNGTVSDSGSFQNYNNRCDWRDGPGLDIFVDSYRYLRIYIHTVVSCRSTIFVKKAGG